jgi:rubredoxin
MFKKSIVKKIKLFFQSFSKNIKSHDLGNLQNQGFIQEIPDIFGCPNCESKNISWKFIIPIDGSKPTILPQEICKDCGYTDTKGEFEKTNKSILRDKKINKLLNGIQ